jgi:hypothetical protein
MRNAHNILVKNPEGKDTADLYITERIIIK